MLKGFDGCVLTSPFQKVELLVWKIEEVIDAQNYPGLLGKIAFAKIRIIVKRPLSVVCGPRDDVMSGGRKF